MKVDEKDIFRDSYLRYCGYTNEIGEALRPLIPKFFVHLSYGIAITYVLADCFDKGKTTYQEPESIGGLQIIRTLKKTGDVFIWQMLASVIVPGIVINRITWGAGRIFRNAKLLPTCIAFATIPVIIKPIDKAVDQAMDHTYRKYV